MQIIQTFEGYVIADAKRGIGSVKVKVDLVGESTGLGHDYPPYAFS